MNRSSRLLFSDAMSHAIILRVQAHSHEEARSSLCGVFIALLHTLRSNISAALIRIMNLPSPAASAANSVQFHDAVLDAINGAIEQDK